jgi:hypothetical protein
MHYTDDSDLSFYGKFRTYKIRKEDTLQSVSQELGIEAKELRRYHNAYCLLADIIEKDFKHYSKFLILAPEDYVKKTNTIIEKKPKKVGFGENNKLPFLPRGICKDYSVEYTFEVGNQIDTMGMAVRVKWLATDDNKYALFEIKRSINLFIDNNEPDRIMDELGARIVDVLYPLKIVVDEFGKWVDIHNYKEIVSRWESKKNEVFNYYKKDVKVTQQLIDFAEDALKSSDQLFTSLSSDYFLWSFFNGIHTCYTADYLFEEEISFPLKKNKELPFKVEQKINPFLNEEGFIEVEQKGDYLNLEKGMDFSSKLWNGKYKALCCLDSHSSFIETMNLECSIDYEEPIKISLIVQSLKKDKTE